MSGKSQDTMQQMLEGSIALTETRYLDRQNLVLKFLFFTLLKKLDLIDTSLPWFSPIEPKPVYKNQRAKAYCDVLFFFLEIIRFRANRNTNKIKEEEDGG